MIQQFYTCNLLEDFLSSSHWNSISRNFLSALLCFLFRSALNLFSISSSALRCITLASNFSIAFRPPLTALTSASSSLYYRLQGCGVSGCANYFHTIKYKFYLKLCTSRSGLDRTGHIMSFQKGQDRTGPDRTPKFVRQVLPDWTDSGLIFVTFYLIILIWYKGPRTEIWCQKILKIGIYLKINKKILKKKMKFFFEKLIFLDFFWIFSSISKRIKSPVSSKHVRFPNTPDFENLPDFQTRRNVW